MPRHLISDAHESETTARERAWQNQRGKKTPVELDSKSATVKRHERSEFTKRWIVHQLIRNVSWV
uniref:Uncharacterized protein n=1 Tax=Xenopus tropicalis TaxID=8364 RepID=A0A803JBR8_XENTR